MQTHQCNIPIDQQIKIDEFAARRQLEGRHPFRDPLPKPSLSVAPVTSNKNTSRVQLFINAEPDVDNDKTFFRDSKTKITLIKAAPQEKQRNFCTLLRFYIYGNYVGVLSFISIFLPVQYVSEQKIQGKKGINKNKKRKENRKKGDGIKL